MMAASILSSSYVRPAPSIACALQNVLQDVTKGPQALSLIEPRLAARTTAVNTASTSGFSGRLTASDFNGRELRWERQGQGWWRRSSNCGMRAQAALLQTTEAPKVCLDLRSTALSATVLYY